jgi:cobalt-zinc-cadmium efflux system membrane fusion protein
MSDTTILLVDDDAVLSQVLRRVLTRQGYRVVEASTVADAVEAARKEKPNLGLVDLCLPDGDGVQLARALEQEGPTLPLILMTAYPLRLRDQPELGEGFARVLTKPLNLEELRHTIEQVLSGAPAAPEPAVPRSHSSTILPRPPVAEAPVPPTPEAPKPAPPKRGRWLVAAVAVAVLLGGSYAAWEAAGRPSLREIFKKKQEDTAAAGEGKGKLLPGDRNSIEMSAEVLKSLGVKFEVVSPNAVSRPLLLAGSLSFDPTRLYRIQARFGGEVIALGTTQDRDTEGKTVERRLRPGDRVKQGKLLAVVLSKDLGEKKSELVDALVKLQVDEDNLTKIQDLYQRGIAPELTYTQQRALVAGDRNAAARAELTLRTWQLSDEEINTIKAEARRVGDLKERRDIAKETEWAKVEVKAPADGVIVEMNVNIRNIVDTTFDLYKVADLKKLGVLLNAYEEDLRRLQGLPEHYPWEVRVSAEPRRAPLDNDGLERIGVIIDPNQHTALVHGRVDNRADDLHVGQFITAKVNLPPPEGVVSVPASALYEDGEVSAVFVLRDPARPTVLTLRRVAVAGRMGETVYLRTDPSAAEKARGMQGLEPGTQIVSTSVVELKAALEEAQARDTNPK